MLSVYICSQSEIALCLFCIFLWLCNSRLWIMTMHASHFCVKIKTEGELESEEQPWDPWDSSQDSTAWQVVLFALSAPCLSSDFQFAP